MFIYVLPIFLIVASNIFYNICQKSIPQNVNPFISLLITYSTAAMLAIVVLIIHPPTTSLTIAFKKTNWTSFVLGFAIVGLEFGYLMAYRAGWKVSMAPMVANIILSVLLIPIGIILFKEGFELNKVFGAALCIAGLILINK
jgi:drug/metabolite transporter (DMT)-like permease